MDSWNRNPTNQRRVVLSHRRGGCHERKAWVLLGEQPLHRSIPPQIWEGRNNQPHRQLRSQSRRPNRLYGIDRCREVGKLELIPSDLTQYRQCSPLTLYASRLLGVQSSSERSTYPRRTVVLSGARSTLLVGRPAHMSQTARPLIIDSTGELIKVWQLRY